MTKMEITANHIYLGGIPTNFNRKAPMLTREEIIEKVEALEVQLSNLAEQAQMMYRMQGNKMAAGQGMAYDVAGAMVHQLWEKTQA